MPRSRGAERRRPLWRRRSRRGGCAVPTIEALERRCVLSATSLASATALPTDPTTALSGQLDAVGQSELYRLKTDAGGQIRVEVHPSGFGPLLSLLDSQGHILIQSEATSRTDPDAQIAQHVPVGTYYLSLTDRTGAGTYQISTTFTRATLPDQPIVEGQGCVGVATANLSGDGIPAIIVPDYYDGQILINYGIGDGTFQPPVAIQVGTGPSFVLAADLTGNGISDLVVANQSSDTLSILMGNGDGTFQPALTLPTCAGPSSIVAGDFDGSGHIDLAVADKFGNCVQIFRGNGEGAFVETDQIDSLNGPASLAAADFQGNGHLDLAVAEYVSGEVTILNGLGNGTFAFGQRLPVGPGACGVVAADFNGDGQPDIAAVSTNNGTVSVCTNRGGHFTPSALLTTGMQPFGVVAADFHGAGHIDLAACNFGSNSVSLFEGNGDGTFQSAVSVPTGSGPMALAAADFNNDGRLDLVTSDVSSLTVSVLMNKGDGTFLSPPPTPLSLGPEGIVSADLTGSGILDLVIPDQNTDAVSVLLGRGDGTFRAPIQIPAGMDPYDVAVGDFTGDSILDLAVADYLSNSVMILQGRGNGTFFPIGTLATGDGPDFVRTADLDGDHHLDLVVANYLSNDVSVFYGLGGGKFTSPQTYRVGIAPSGLVLGDFNGDGPTDIAVSDSGSSDVEIVLNTGDRTFAAPASYSTGYDQPWAINAADLNHDGHLDLFVTDSAPSEPQTVAVLMGNGDGTFQPAAQYVVGDQPYPVVAGDFTGDGNLDLVAGNDVSNDLSLLIGRGDGTFAPAVELPAGKTPYGIVAGDFNRDGHLDIAVVDEQSDDVTIELGNGDGTFQAPTTQYLAESTLPMVTADFDDNGNLDLAIANPDTGTVTIETGQGNGSFTQGTTIDTGGHPSGLVVGDFNHDGRPDLAVADSGTDEVLILLGNGDGTFQGPIRYTVGSSPQCLVVGDFIGNGQTDLAAADTGSNDITLLYGNGDGTFQVGPRLPVGSEPVALVAADLTQTGRDDLITADRSSDDLTIWWALGGGRFQKQTLSTGCVSPTALVAGDFFQNGRIDLAYTAAVGDELLVLSGLGGGEFSAPLGVNLGLSAAMLVGVASDSEGSMASDLAAADQSGNVVIVRGQTNGTLNVLSPIALGIRPGGIAFGNVAGSGRLDMIAVSAPSGAVEVLLSKGQEQYAAPERYELSPSPAPLVVTTPSGAIEVLTVDANGQILERIASSDFPGQFSSPIDLTAGTSITVNAGAVLTCGGLPAVAWLDARDSCIWIQQTDVPGFDTIEQIPLPAGGIYTRLAAGDLSGDGLGDLVVLDLGSDQVLVLAQDAVGNFQLQGKPIPVGFGPTDVTVSGADRADWHDIVVTNGSSGDVSIIACGPNFRFMPEVRVRAGLSASGTVSTSAGIEPVSTDEPVGVTTGIFGSSGLTDVVAVLSGANRISLLQGTPDGGVADPNLATSYSTGIDPVEAVVAPLGRNGLLDIAVLNERSDDVSIYMNDGHGGFITLPRVDAGNDPTGLSVRDVNCDGISDLLVSNSSGDLLIMLGNGDGTFRPYQRAEDNVGLAVGDLNGDGKLAFVFSNKALDALSVQYQGSTPYFVQGRSDGILAPGPVVLCDLTGNGKNDLIVANAGANDVLVFLGLGNGRFAAPLRFFTGTSPVGLTVADLNGDGIPDLVVANEGSNDLTILFGEGEGADWTFVPGPRLKVGDRPVSTAVADVDGIPDIFCVNQGSDDVTLLRGVGGGFFDDRNPVVFAAGHGPIQAFFGRFGPSLSPGLIILNSQSSTLTYYPGPISPNEAPITLPSGGLDPVAGVTGYFAGNGFADLVVANGGDSRLAVFTGGIAGIALSNTVSLGAGNQVTDLAIVPDSAGGFELFVSTQKEGQVIGLTIFSTSAAASGAAVAGVQTAFASAGWRSSATTDFGLLLSADTALQTEEGPAAQSQASVQTTAPVDALGRGVATVTVFAQGLLPFLSDSLAAFTGLGEDLLHFRQMQTSDVLPLGQTDSALVAVLLSVTQTTDLEPSDAGEQLVTQNDAEDDMVSNEREPIHASAVDRLLCSPEAPRDLLCRELREGTGRPAMSDSEWVWSARTSEGCKSAARTADRTSPALTGLTSTDAGRRPAADLDVPPSGKPAPAIESERLTRHPENPGGSAVCMSHSAVALAVLSGVLIGAAVWKARRRVLETRKHPSGGNAGPRFASVGRYEPVRGPSVPGRSDRSNRDLPPWVTSAVSGRLAGSTKSQFSDWFGSHWPNESST